MGIQWRQIWSTPLQLPKKIQSQWRVCLRWHTVYVPNCRMRLQNISCNVPNCNCFYVGKSQLYDKMRVQELIGAVTKLYNKCILLPNCTATRSTPPSAPSQGASTRSSTTMSLAPQSLSKTSYKDPIFFQLAQGLCVPINTASPHPPISITITRTPSDVGHIGPTGAPPPPIVHFPETPQTTAPFKRQQDNC